MDSATVERVTDEDLIDLLRGAADAVSAALTSNDAWGLTETSDSQHHSDLRADAAAVEHLVAAGLGVMSEESGRHHPERDLTVVVDPLDGSTNAAHRIPWYAASLCVLDADGPRASLVRNLAADTEYTAMRGGGARRNGEALAPSSCRDLNSAIVGISALPEKPPGWRQFRALGAAALDLCLVAEGSLDGWIDFGVDAHGSWDYLGGLLVCQEAGGVVVDAWGRDLITVEHLDRRTPVAAATPELLEQLVVARTTCGR